MWCGRDIGGGEQNSKCMTDGRDREGMWKWGVANSSSKPWDHGTWKGWKQPIFSAVTLDIWEFWDAIGLVSYIFFHKDTMEILTFSSKILIIPKLQHFVVEGSFFFPILPGEGGLCDWSGQERPKSDRPGAGAGGWSSSNLCRGFIRNLGIPGDQPASR